MELARGFGYLELRERSDAGVAVRELHPDSPPESLLQVIWLHQRLDRTRLVTDDGESVQVLHPGFLNAGRGPDFRNAVVRFGSGRTVTGDVEVDIDSEAWVRHQHRYNPDYSKVILHVVWTGGVRTPGQPPVLQVRDRTDSPISELAWWYGRHNPKQVPPNVPGACSVQLRRMDPGRLRTLLFEAAETRLRARAARLAARARLVGWTQALWEGLFRGLGYKHNEWPMFRLAELRPNLPGPEAGLRTLQAILFGLSGLLPAELPRRSRAADRFVRELWDSWWRCQTQYHELMLPAGVWRLGGSRPANHPHRRIALGAHWLADREFVRRIEAWALEPGPNPVTTLAEILRAGPDPFWETHYSLFSRPGMAGAMLLGRDRVTDLAVNTILPWLFARALETGAGAEPVLRLYFSWPAGQDNSVLKLARQRLFGTDDIGVLEKLAAVQQGLIQIVYDFCCYSDPLCTHCSLVRAL